MKRWRSLLSLVILSGVVGGVEAASPAVLVPQVVQPFLAHPRAQRVATDGRNVFILSNGLLRSFNPALTKSNWTVPLKSYGGLSAGEGLVVVDNGFSALTAFDAATGRQRWKAAAPRSLTWGGAAPIQTPLIRLQVAQGSVLAASSDDVRAWDARTGRLRWQVEAADPSWLGVSGNIVTFTARRGLDGYLRAVNLLNGRALWSLTTELTGEVLTEHEGGPYLYAVQRYSSRPRLQLVEVSTGQHVVVEYQFPAWGNISTFLQRDTLCAAGTLNHRQQVTCLPRTAGQYVKGDKNLLDVLRRTPLGLARWEQQVRQVVHTQSGGWVLGGHRAVQVRIPAGLSGCGSIQNFHQAGDFAVAKMLCGQGKGRIVVLDQQTGRVAAVVMGHGEVTDAHLVQGRLIIVTDQDVLSVPAPQ